VQRGDGWRARVTASPAAGRVDAAAQDTLAKEIGVPRSRRHSPRRQTARDTTFEVL